MVPNSEHSNLKYQKHIAFPFQVLENQAFWTKQFLYNHTGLMKIQKQTPQLVSMMLRNSVSLIK